MTSIADHQEEHIYSYFFFVCRWTILWHSLARWIAYPLLLDVFTRLVSTENDNSSHSITLLFMHWTILRAVVQEIFWMPCLARPQVLCPFSSRLPPMSPPLCQLSLEQMGWFSMASHQPTQWHVKQAVTGLAVPSTAILYHHMGIMCAEIILDQQTVLDTWPNLTKYLNK